MMVIKNTLKNQAKGRVKIYENGNKFYLAWVKIEGESRWGKRKFRTAEAADQYGERLVARYVRLKDAAMAKEEL